MGTDDARPVGEQRRKTIDEIFAEGVEIDRALRRGVRLALLEHKRAGNPIAEWRDGKVVWVPPEEIPDYDPNSDD